MIYPTKNTRKKKPSYAKKKKVNNNNNNNNNNKSPGPNPLKTHRNTHIQKKP